MEFGIVMESSPGYTASIVAEIENLGFDFLLCPDTQNLAPDPIGQLSLASKSTSKLYLGAGVTNPITRDVSVVACSMTTLHLESGGRAICGVGREDSSTAHIGTKISSTSKLKKFIVDFKKYVIGKQVTRNGKESRFRWIEDTITQPLTVDVACTGPKTIEMAEDVTDRVSFAVGSAPEQLEWALSVAENRLKIIGRPEKVFNLVHM